MALWACMAMSSATTTAAGVSVSRCERNGNCDGKHANKILHEFSPGYLDFRVADQTPSIPLVGTIENPASQWPAQLFCGPFESVSNR